VPASHEFSLVPKAVPEEDTQFQADAKRLLKRIRDEHPDAIIIVAGHSMGGNAVARLGANTPVDIDLLAPMDPVGNRSEPIGRPTSGDPRPDRTFNWTRWRAKFEFAGFRIADCVRNNIGLCENFGTFLKPDYHCRGIGNLLPAPPAAPASLAPGLCPGPRKYIDSELTFGKRIKRLYHRWQNESVFPFDFLEKEIYKFHGSTKPKDTFSTAFANMQFPVNTCASGVDPRDHNRECDATDGHGEIVGFRAPTSGQPNPPGPNFPVAPLALQARGGWLQYDEQQSALEKTAKAAFRREKMLELATADDSWPHRPLDPDLDMVSADMIRIVEDLLASQPLPSLPTTVATPTPGPNEHGWNNTDVVVNLTATAGTGHTVTQIEYTLSGAQPAGTVVHHGDSVDVPIGAEGDTTITFFARDNGGNVEEPQELIVRIDRTPPAIIGTANPPPNANGWNNTDVTVTFTAQDALSGVDVVDGPVTITAEGAGQEAIGTATDLADNTSATIVTVNIDKTRPVLSGLPDPACVLWPPNQKFVVVASVSASDALSGVAPGSLVVGATSNEAQSGDIVIAGSVVQVRAQRLGSGGGRVYTVTATVRDKADNAATQSGSCAVPHDRGKR
jgi:hypothetical protein